MVKTGLLVVGGGSGGVRAARMAAQQGVDVVLFEESRLGGTCVNLGCVPKKLFSYAAGYSHEFEEAASYGWRTEGSAPTLDWSKLRDAKDKEIARLNGIYESNLEKAGVEIVKARAQLTGPATLVAGDKEYQADAILIATGSRPALLPTPGYEEHASVSDDIFALPELPRRAVIAGAGYIAVEFASILADMGVEATLVHRGPTVLKKFDASIQKRLLEEMARLGVKLELDSSITGLERTGDRLVVKIDGKPDIETDLLLAATGRTPNTAGLGLEQAGVETARNGAITVDDTYQSNVAGVYAVGDVNGRSALTPVAIAEGMRFVACKYGGVGPPVDYQLIPTAVFTHPNVGTVGMTEEQARERHPDCEVCMSEFTPMRQALTGSGEKTMVKLVSEKDGGKVLGAHMVGSDAGELIQGIAVAMACGATKREFDATIGIHPTTAEEFVSMR